jgi:hypothetical protein
VKGVINHFIAALREAFVTPTSKQREAYGRFLHNLAAACLIASISIIFTENPYGARHVVALFASGVICFVVGAFFCRDE